MTDHGWLRAAAGAPGRLRRWPWRDVVELPRTLVLLVAAELAVRRLRLPNAAQAFRTPLTTAADPPALHPPADLDAGERRRIRVTRRLTRHWPFAAGACLREALVLGFHLRHRGPVLRVGAFRQGTALTAHAWIELPDGSIGATDDLRPLGRP